MSETASLANRALYGLCRHDSPGRDIKFGNDPESVPLGRGGDVVLQADRLQVVAALSSLQSQAQLVEWRPMPSGRCIWEFRAPAVQSDSRLIVYGRQVRNMGLQVVAERPGEKYVFSCDFAARPGTQ